ncbi:MAG: 4-hydroxy-2-oxovalerate aldolase [Alphaproteobacteria bacterium]|nr:4-hydroxy-2-oxovalerate aldolase [Alphaproteobacteria bacterium]
MEDNIVKQRLSRGEKLFGVWTELGSPTAVELLGLQGFDFVLIDLEHGPGDLGDLVSMLRAARSVGAPTVVRVPSADPVFLKRVMDAGVHSIMIPAIETEAEARAAVAACRYPPKGVRGYASPIVRASGYGHKTDYMTRWNDNLLLILQIESAKAAAKASRIAAVDGVDMVFIGVNDMGGSIGRLEQLDHPDVRKLVAKSEAAILKSSKWMGGVPSAGAGWREMFEGRYHMVPLAIDVIMLREAARAVVKEQMEFHGRGGAKVAAQAAPSYASVPAKKRKKTS